MAYYACKLCIWDKRLYGESFREPESWYRDPEELLAHLRAEHANIINWRTDMPSWPGMLEDARAHADGYLVCDRGLEPSDGMQFTCYRCDATTYHFDPNNLYCLACGRRFENHYRPRRWVIARAETAPPL